MQPRRPGHRPGHHRVHLSHRLPRHLRSLTSRGPPRGASNSTPPSLESMPAEILHIIVSHLWSSKQAIKALRQTSRRFVGICASHLFISLHVSALHRDRDNFVGVVSSPHLACHVRTLVWEELTGDFDLLEPENVWDIFNDELPTGPIPWQERQDQNLMIDLAAQIKRLFWFKSYHAITEMKRRDKNESDNVIHEPDVPFWNNFVQATNALPNLSTLVSRPMSPNRQVQRAAEGCYPLTVCIILRYLHASHPPFDYPSPIFNAGFVFYLIPLLKLHSERGYCRIRTLCFSDESVTHMTALGHLTTHDSHAFSNISHLELKLTDRVGPQGWAGGDMDVKAASIRSCLKGAKSLKSIHLTCTQILPLEWDMFGADIGIQRPMSPLAMIPALPSLRSASLENVRSGQEAGHSKEDDGLFNWAQPALVDFVKRQAPTLRELQISGSIVTESTINQFAQDPSIKFDRFVIMVPDYDVDTCSFDEQQILDIINWNCALSDDPRDARRMLISDAPQMPTLTAPPSTHKAEYQPRDWTTAALNGSERELVLLQNRNYTAGQPDKMEEVVLVREEDDDELDEHRRTFKNGMWVDANGIYYDRSADEDVPKPSRQSVSLLWFDKEPGLDDWTFQNGRHWDRRFGLWQDCGIHDQWRLHKYSKDRDLVAGEDSKDDPEPTDWIAEGMHTPRHMLSLPPAESPAICSMEDFDQIVRRENGPRWRFGRGEDDVVHFWRVLSDDYNGYRTEVWQFEHRNGEVAWGNDPLDFWPDWRGEAFGDRAYATPYGWTLWFFVKRKSRRVRGVSLGWQVPKTCGPDNAFGKPQAYRLDDDPLVAFQTRLSTPVPWDFDVEDLQLCQEDIEAVCDEGPLVFRA